MVVAGVLRRHDGRILICQRAASQRHPLQWEFPGGKREAGESESAALARELEEELGIEVRAAEIGALLLRRRYQYPETGWLELAFYDVPRWRGEPSNRIFAQILWEQAPALGAYDFLAADRPLLELLQ
ncbi:MAG: (deoxy)nucleoside triphosphate pyrophosphohydrolase [Terriglobales bacterium]